MFNPLDAKRAREVFPFYSGSYSVPVYIKPESLVKIKIDSREQELSILAAYDYGIDALNEQGRQHLANLIADLKVAITGS